MNLRSEHYIRMIVILVTIISPFSIEICLPSIPKIADDLHVPTHLVQLMISIYILGFAISGFICGALSDLFGRRVVMLIALIVGIIGGAICCGATDLYLLYGGRFLQGLGLGGAQVLCFSICKDISYDSINLSKLVSSLGIMALSAVVCAPIVGGYIQLYLFWRLSFILIVLFNLCILSLCYVKLIETNKFLENYGIINICRGYLEIVGNQKFLMLNFVSGAVWGGFIAYQTMSASLLEEFVGLSPHEFGYTSILVMLSLITGSIINKRNVSHLGLVKMMWVGFLLFMFAGVLYIVFAQALKIQTPLLRTLLPLV